MGNRKFKFSEIIPNAWFFKLKEMGAKTHHPGKKKPAPPPPQPPQETEYPVPYSRKSYHFTRDLNLPPLDPPRKSSKKKRPTSEKPPTKSFSSGSSSSSASPGGETCVLIDVDNKSLGRKTEDSVSRILKLPPIKTERQRFDELVKEIGEAVEAIDVPVKVKKNSVKNENLPVKLVREEESFVFKEQGIRPVRRLLTTSPRVRVRINSPRIARRTQVNSSKGSVRKNISSDSMAVVKSSSDPKKDFRESMVEMIVENNIRASKDLEELLACYLSLNSNEYHDVIIQVFKQIWFDLNNSTRLSEVVAS